jgi:hypothetical protein
MYIERSCTIFDLMVVVAATAISSSLSLGEIPPAVETSSILRPLPRGWSFMLVAGRILTLLPVLFPWFAIWTLAILIARLRRPRPRGRGLARQPGFVACCSVATVLMIQYGPGLLAAIMNYPPPARVDARQHVLVFLHPSWTGPGLAVMAAWLALAMNQAWRPVPGWIDGSGRVLGFFWIAVVIIDRFFPGYI